MRDDDDIECFQRLSMDEEDARREARWEAAQQRRRTACQCRGMEMPGSCPGPRYCPMATVPDDEDAAP